MRDDSSRFRRRRQLLAAGVGAAVLSVAAVGWQSVASLGATPARSVPTPPSAGKAKQSASAPEGGSGTRAGSSSSTTATVGTAGPGGLPRQAGVTGSTQPGGAGAAGGGGASSPSGTTAAAVIGVSGTHLVLNGVPYRFVGLNAYELATEWGVNAGCGGMESQTELDQLFTGLPAGSLVRISALQGSMAINVHTRQLDWGPLDRVFAAAAAYGQRLIVTLATQGGTCDNGHWQDLSWYQGDFNQVFDDPATTDGRGLTPLSYADYVHAAVTHFRSSPALGMWEPINEPTAATCPTQDQPVDCAGHETCPDEAVAAAAMRHFYDAVGAEIHALDPNHLIESGILGGGQCGTSGADYATVSASPGIDVLSYHDYYGTSPMGGDQWNGLGERFAQAAALGKPIIGGEVGLNAGTAPGCSSLAQRTSDFDAKLAAQLRAGSSGLLVWDWEPAPTGACDFSTYPGDPLLSAVAAGVS